MEENDTKDESENESAAVVELSEPADEDKQKKKTQMYA